MAERHRCQTDSGWQQSLSDALAQSPPLPYPETMAQCPNPGAYNSISVSAAHIAVMMSVIPPTTPQRT